jgi:hypothetical protein
VQKREEKRKMIDQKFENHASLADSNKDRKEKYRTLKNRFSDFKVNQRVIVICVMQDFHHWNGEQGKVIKIRPDALYPVTVQFNPPLQRGTSFTDSWDLKMFSFKPDDLITFASMKKLKKEWELQSQLLNLR